MRNRWMPVVLMVLAGCSTLASAPEAVQAPVLDQAACQQQGGRWAAIGRAQHWICLMDYADAGKACGDASQCQGNCLVDGEHLSSGLPATGVCQRDASERFGCRQAVENGIAGSVLCID